MSLTWVFHMPQLDYLSALGYPSSAFPDRTNQVNLLLMANGLPVTADFTAQSKRENNLFAIH